MAYDKEIAADAKAEGESYAHEAGETKAEEKAEKKASKLEHFDGHGLTHSHHVTHSKTRF